MKAFRFIAAVLAVLFASMVGATRVEAQGLGDIFRGDSSIGRIIGAGAIGAGAGAVGGAILGKDIGAGKGALAGAAIGGIIQGALELTDNVPISCGSAQPYQDPNTGQLYCGGSGPSVATPPFFPQQNPCAYDPRACAGPAVYGGGTTIYTDEVIVVGGRRYRNYPQPTQWPVPHVDLCSQYPHLCQSSLGWQQGQMSGYLDRLDTDRYNQMRRLDNARRREGAWQEYTRDRGWQQGFFGGPGPSW